MKKGFTLLELLVVIAVIGVLAALSLPNFMSARERARDTQRKSDLVQIQKALELYKLDHQDPVRFPPSLPNPGSRWEGDDPSIVYMNKFPGDPSDPLNKSYFYSVDNNTLTYKLQACLENAADRDGQPCDLVSCNDGQDICYIVNQP